MVMIKHELKQGRITLLIWTMVIALMMALCVLIYPEMETQMGDVSAVFAEMGGFSAAFFGVECGNILGLGGAFFAALLGISVLVKEEKEQTAEFLLTHPVSRREIVGKKLVSVLIQILLLNLSVAAVTAVSICAIGETPDIRPLFLLFLAYFILQVEVASVCFGISAFLNQGGAGIGLGMAALLYFLNIIANLTEQVKFLKYLTPFGILSVLQEGYPFVKIYIDKTGLICYCNQVINHITVNIHSFTNDIVTFHSKDDVLTLLVHLGYLQH